MEALSDEPTPLVPQSHGALGERILGYCVKVTVRGSLLVSPRLTALLLRKAFAPGGAKVAEGLKEHTPAYVILLVDQCYGDERDMLLDIFRPSTTNEALQTLM